MNALLICPSPRPTVEYLTQFAPLAGVPLMGECLIEYWLTHLALEGATEVRILADDRAAQIATIVNDGARWGLKAEVVVESRELSAAQAQIKYAKDLAGAHPGEVAVLDHFPGRPETPLFESYAGLFTGMLKWLPHAVTIDRVAIRELKPGIWASSHAHISPDARIEAPCWIGHNVYVGANAVLGPMTIIEDRSFIEPEAEIISSVIGPDTFVGQFATVEESFAWGNSLVNWRENVSVTVKDPFLLSALRRPPFVQPAGGENILGRLAEIYARNKDDLQMFWKHFLMNKEG